MSIGASWQPQSQLITPADLPRVLAQHRVVVVHCDAVWDRGAAILDRTIQDVRKSFTQEVGFYALDIDASLKMEEGRELRKIHELYSAPTCICFINGVKRGSFIGDLPLASVTAKVRSLVAIANADDLLDGIQAGGHQWGISIANSVSYVYSRKFERSFLLHHGITLRNQYMGECNLSFSVTQNWGQVRANRDAACHALHFEYDKLIVPAQTHGAKVAIVTGEDAGRGALFPVSAVPDCEALVTNTPGLLLGITIADCLPIFFLDTIHNVIGLAHSGWRGASRRIAVRTLETMTARFGTHPAACLVAIGPGIGPDGYEVDERVYNGFAPDDAQAEGVFTPTRPGHWRLDLFAAVTHQLKQASVPADNFDICPYRTDRDTDLFFSHRLVPGCGRMGAFIGLHDK